MVQTCGATASVARLGGDEFAILIRDSSIGQAMTLAETLVANIGRLVFQWQEQSFGVGASIGLTAISADKADAATALHEADKACYAAKQSGRNKVCKFNGEHRSYIETEVTRAA